MKSRRERLTFGLLAGLLALLGFSSCHSSKNVTREHETGTWIHRKDSSHVIIAMYGVRPRDYIEIAPKNRE